MQVIIALSPAVDVAGAEQPKMGKRVTVIKPANTLVVFKIYIAIYQEDFLQKNLTQ